MYETCSIFSLAFDCENTVILTYTREISHLSRYCVLQAIMTKMFKDPNAKRGTHSDNLLGTLVGMNTTLEAIQRSLDMYLETKRQFFPRFYFLSNDDLLEILGQSKNPEAVSGIKSRGKKCCLALLHTIEP